MPAWMNYCAKSALLLRVVFDTNVVIAHLRRQQQLLPLRAVLPFAVVGELEAFALKADWGYQKVAFLRQLLERWVLLNK